MLSKRTLKMAVLASALVGLTACETFGTGSAGAGQTEGSVATTAQQPVVQAAPIPAAKKGANDLAIHVGNTQSKKADQEHKIKAGDIQFFTSGIILQRDDIINVFVAKTNNDEPALALRLKPEAIAKLNQARRGHSHVLASINGSVVSTVEGAHGNLTDGVLLLPMPTLISARDAADLIR